MERRRKIIAVAVPKGGVGKTATAVNLAASLAAAEKKTLLIDVDPSGACSTYLGFQQEDIKGDIFNIFNFTKSIDQVIHKTNLDYLDFIPVNITSFQMEERLGRLATNPFLFRNIIHQEILPYDYIIIDCPPYLKGITTIALTTANSVLIPIRAGQFSISALEKIFEHIKWVRENLNADLKIEGILLTMYEAKTKAWSLTKEKLRNEFRNYVLETLIPKSITITESEFYGKPSILFDASSKGSVAYLELAYEIINKSEEEKDQESTQIEEAENKPMETSDEENKTELHNKLNRTKDEEEMIEELIKLKEENKN